MRKIDISKPLQLADGTPVRLRSATGTTIVVDGMGPDRYIDGSRGRCFNTDGAHQYGELPDLMNVPSATLDTSKPLTTTDGKPVKFIGTMSDGRLVVEVHYGSARFGTPATELRYPDGRKSKALGVTTGDDLVVKVEKSTRYLNVYSDGSSGKTVHKSFETARDNSKYGKVRVGIVEQKLEDGVVVSAKCMPSVQPWYRDADCIAGRPATAADFGR